MEVPLSPESAEIIQARRDYNMATSRLEHAILQTVINYVADEEHLSREQIIMALINVSGYWQKKVVLSAVSAKLKENYGS